jgi:PA14 domain
MYSRYTAIFLTLLLTFGFGTSLFLQPSPSQANLRIGWTGEYFNNMELAGKPAVTTIDEIIDMNWVQAAPFEGLNDDYFSVRWTTQSEFKDGIYRFRAGADDGIRLLIDGKTVINIFEPGTFQTITRDIQLEDGDHLIQVEYFEATGLAGVLVEWQTAETPTDVLDLNTGTVNTLSSAAAPYLMLIKQTINLHAAHFMSALQLWG